MNDGTRHHSQRDGGPAFWIGIVVDWAIIVIGIRMGLHDRELEPGLLVRWSIGGLILHDALWLPFVAAVGAGLAVLGRRRVPFAITWATATSAVLALIAWPFVRGYGRRADVPSALQRNYAHGLVMYVAAVWLVAVVVVLVGRVRRARPESSPSTAEVPTP